MSSCACVGLVAVWKPARNLSRDCDIPGSTLFSASTLGGNRRGTFRGIATSLESIHLGLLKWKPARNLSRDCDILRSRLTLTRPPVETGEEPFEGLRHGRGLVGDMASSPRGNRRGTFRGIATYRNSLSTSMEVRVETGEEPFEGLRHPKDCPRPRRRCLSGNRRGTFRGIATLAAAPMVPQQTSRWKPARNLSRDCDSSSGTHPEKFQPIVETGEEPFEGLRPYLAKRRPCSAVGWKPARNLSRDCDIFFCLEKTSGLLCGNRRGTFRGIATVVSNRSPPLRPLSGNRRGTFRGIATHFKRDQLTLTPPVETGEEPFEGLRHNRATERSKWRTFAVETGEEPFEGLRQRLAGIGSYHPPFGWKPARNLSRDCDWSGPR